MFNENGFHNNDDGFGGSGSEPGQGSFYSPRNGEENSGYYGNSSAYGSAAGSNEEPPRKKSHKGLKALGVFAAIAFLSYASITCYQFAMKNESLRQIFGKDSSAVEESNLQTEAQTTRASDTTSADNSAKADTLKSKDNGYELKSLIELASREGSMSVPDIVDKLMPSSVGVSSTFIIQRQGFSMWGFGGSQTYEDEANGKGTGIVMSKDGYILTNAHVIYDSENGGGLAKEVKVVLNEKYYTGDNQLNATVVDYDVAEDIAVLKVDSKEELVAAEFGNSDDLRVGELVIAIGNPLGFDLFGSVTTGIVSALDREVTINENTMNLIQTDAAINSGNSGGPLINSYGQVIGINSAKLSSSYYGSASVEGLCFAIPISHAKQIVDDLIQYGYVRGKPLLGITGKSINEETAQAYGLPVGVYVQRVAPGGAADLAGIKVSDVIIAVNGKTIATYDEMNAEKDKYKAGDTITVTVTRRLEDKYEDMEFSLVLQEKVPTDIN